MSNHPSIRYWEHNNAHELLKALIGVDYGPAPVNETKRIQSDKEKMARYLLKQVGANRSSKGLEIGSGCGYLTRVAAEQSKFVIACDISQTFLETAKSHCRDLNNISFVHMLPSDLSFLEKESLEYAFSNNVFIHLDIFEIVHYLRGVEWALKTGGKFWFDFAEIERVHALDSEDFKISVEIRKADPTNKGCIQFNSSAAILNIAENLGFSVLDIYRGGRCNTSVLLEKGRSTQGSKKFGGRKRIGTFIRSKYYSFKFF